jgi:hypothetical protein
MLFIIHFSKIFFSSCEGQEEVEEGGFSVAKGEVETDEMRRE